MSADIWLHVEIKSILSNSFFIDLLKCTFFSYREDFIKQTVMKIYRQFGVRVNGDGSQCQDNFFHT